MKNQILKIMRVINSLGISVFFTHGDMREVAYRCRMRYGLDFFKGSDPQDLIFLCLSSNSVVISRSFSIRKVSGYYGKNILLSKYSRNIVLAG